MTLKVLFIFLVMHLVFAMGEMWALSMAGRDAGWQGIHAINQFSQGVTGLQTVLSNPLTVLDVVGKFTSGIWSLFSFQDYRNVFAGDLENIRVFVSAFGYGVLLLLVWRVVGGAISAVIGNITGRVASFFGG